MRPTFRICRIAGVDIGVHWTWLLIVALIGWSLAAGVFPDANPGLGNGTYVAMAFVAVPVFFACLLLHELGHAVRAQREGMEIEGITLWVFGGVAQFRGQFPSAGAELRIAIAGPVVSLVLGGGLLATAILVPLPPAVDGVVHWLGYINLFLLAFNMLPALPLDGGRVLRAALWGRRGDFLAATRAAAALGAGFGRFLLFGGVALAVLGGGIGGLWLALIGWFLLGAAEAEAAAAEQSATLAPLHVSDAMAPRPVVVPADMPLDRFIEDVFGVHRHTAYPVLDGERPVGLISFRDAAKVAPQDRRRLKVRNRMVPLGRALVVGPRDALDGALLPLLQTPLRRAAVIEHGELVGLLSVTDVLRLLEAHVPGEALRAA